MDIIDNLQEKCFSMLGTINDLKQSETQNNEITNRFNKDVTELMQAVSAFFVKPSEE